MSRVRELSRMARRVPGVRRILETSDPQRRAARLAHSGLVDAELYAAQLGVPHLTAEQAALHYATKGFREGFTLNVLLDPYVIRRNLIRTDRPVLYDWLNSRAWHAETSGVWSRRDYVDRFPEAVEHPAGPAGHLWERVRSDPETPVTVEPGGKRALPWSQLYPVLFEATVAWADQLRDRRERYARASLDHDADLGDVALPADAPTVSIVLPVWNRAAGLRKAVDSVLAQSWPHWELLIVDDGSWDDTPDVAELLAGRDPRITVVRRAHEGVCAARNAGIDQAKGRYLAFLDSDNVWQPHFLRDVVTTMERNGHETAYATVALTSAEGTTRYRYGSPALESLLRGNSIDLNVLVSRLDAVRAVGGFDPQLRRAVDYDLILKLAGRGQIAHVPVIGAVYDNSDSAEDRISTTEPVGWNTLVRLRHLPGREPTRMRRGTTIVALFQRHDARMFSKIRALTAAAADADTSVIIAAVGVKPDEWRRIRVAALGRDGVEARLFAQGEPYAYVVGTAAAGIDRESMVVLDPCSHYDHDRLRRLADAAESTPDSAFVPLTVGRTGTVESVGSLFTPPHGTPGRLFQDHPVEDAQRIGDDVEVPSLSGRSFALPTRAFRRAGGLDPLLSNEYEAEGLSLRLHSLDEPLRIRALTDVVLPQTAPPLEFAAVDPWGTRLALRECTSSVPASDPSPFYAPLDQRVASWHGTQASDRPAAATVLTPIVTRERRTVVVDGREVPRLRWAIRTGAPAGPDGESWGDTHFARSLATALGELGQDAVVVPRDAAERSTRSLDDVHLVLRGLDRVQPLPGMLNLLWVISHPDLVSRHEAAEYDQVFAASLAWSRAMTARWEVPIEPLLQCTDPTVFHPSGEGRGGDILFVGNSRGIPRPTVMETVRAGIPLTLYGGEWERFVPEEVITGTYVDNHRLGVLYGSASVVLNDHWADMKREGFISNRLFDAVAAGGRVLSDEVAGIDEIFAGAVHTYRTVSEIAPDLRGSHDELFAGESELERISERIRAEHSFRTRAGQLLDRVLDRFTSADAAR